MATTCIYTLEPIQHGGVMAKVREVAALQTRFGHAVQLLYTATNQVPTANRWDKLRYFMRTPPRWEMNCGFRGFAVPDWPMPFWASYAVPTLVGLPAIHNSHIHVVVSGSNHCGLPAALLNKKYIVWIGTLYEEELIGRAAAGDTWAKRILTGPAHSILAREEKLIFDRAALILTNGAHTAGAVKREHPSTASRVRVLIYPVDADTFKPDPAPRSIDREPYLLFTARINDPRKNVGLLFRAFARVRTQFPQLRLVLTGDPPEANVLRSLADARVADAVTFAGYQSRESLIKLYQGAELFVLPSSQEGLGISMLEALACGLPVVSTRCGGPESVIVDGLTGRLTPNGDEIALADAILDLLDHPDQLNVMRVQSAAYARDNFSRRVVESRLLDAFQFVYPEYFVSPFSPAMQGERGQG